MIQRWSTACQQQEQADDRALEVLRRSSSNTRNNVHLALLTPLYHALEHATHDRGFMLLPHPCKRVQ
jgi:hypothetical protein